MSFEPIWSGIIACYLFLAGLGGGAFITSAFIRWRHPEAVRMRVYGHIIAPVAVIIGLVLLMFDATAGLQNPLRFALLLSNFNSVMTWGVVFLACFMVVSIIVLVMDILKKSVPRWLEIVGAVFGVCVAMYTGALLGVCKTFPLWNTALLPVLFLVSAMSAGAASVLFVSIFAHADEFNRVGVLKKFHFCLPIIALIPSTTIYSSSITIKRYILYPPWSFRDYDPHRCPFSHFALCVHSIVFPIIQPDPLFYISDPISVFQAAHISDAHSVV